MRATRLAIAAVMLAATAIPARASLLLSDSGGGAYSQFLSYQDYSVGIEFTVGATDKLITSLGILDAHVGGNGGLVSPHDLTLWDTSGNLLASITIPTGTGPSLINGFRFVDLASGVKVDAGKSYIVAARYANPSASSGFNDYLYYDSPSQVSGVMSSDFTFVQGRLAAGNAFPSNTFASAYVGPNFQYTGVTASATTTPEPTSLALAGFAGIGMAAGAWRRRRQQKQQAA